MKNVPRFIALCALLAMPLALFAASSAPQVKTEQGIVEGKDDGTVRAFLGIPYAAPPVGDLRWKPAVPVAKWEGVHKATEFTTRSKRTLYSAGSGQSDVVLASNCRCTECTEMYRKN